MAQTTKEKVLDFLISDRENSISGEELAKDCGVTRTAIWKAISSLRNDGFEIEGTTNGGYIFKDIGDAVSVPLFSFCLSEKYPQFKNSVVECFKEIDSTNSYAKRLLAKAGSIYSADGSLSESGKKLKDSIYVAESQSGGRGRMGRIFYSPEKSGIYLSVIYAPNGGIKNPAKVTAFAAVATSRAIKKVCGIEPKIKWINDLFFDGKKICGILAEGITNFETGAIEAAVVGIGINIVDNFEDFPNEVKQVAGSIGKKVPRCRLAAAVAGEFFSIFDENPNDVINEYKEKSFLIGKNVKIQPIAATEDGSYFAKAVDIDDEAALVVELADGKRISLSTGEVRVFQES